jgi:DNA-binding protein WhiA
MSFSTDVKEELSRLSNLADKDSVKAELYGYLNSVNVSEVKNKLKFTTESEYNINRFSKLLNNVNIINYDIDINGKNFNIFISNKEKANLKNIYENYFVPEKESIEKSFVRGVFLGSGSINNPKNKYHIEIILNNIDISEIIIKILEKYGILLKLLNNKTKISIYSKDGEEISKFLAFIGANKAVIKFEEIRVYRDMRNNVNRIVNCETANLNKTVNAAVKQIEAIKRLKETGEFNNLPDNLKELARLRIENPEATLTELGKMLKEPIGKSGVNYRLNTIIKKSL